MAFELTTRNIVYVTGGLVVVLIVLLLVNDRTSKCLAGDVELEDGVCSHIPINDACRPGEGFVDGTCQYEKAGFLDRTVSKIILWALLASWLSVLFYKWYSRRRQRQTKELAMFRKEDRITPLEAIDSFFYFWCVLFRQPCAKNKDDTYEYNRDMFIVDPHFIDWEQPSTRERFVKFQFEVIGGDAHTTGIHTANVSLYRGREAVENGVACRFENENHYNYKLRNQTQAFPIANPQSLRERILDQTLQTNPEEVLETLQDEDGKLFSSTSLDGEGGVPGGSGFPGVPPSLPSRRRFPFRRPKPQVPVGGGL